jgi:hypothetical protein
MLRDISFATFSAALVLQCFFAPLTTAQQKLKDPQLFVGPEGYELSGFTWMGERLLAVSDAKSDHYVYEVIFEHSKKSYSLNQWLDLRTLSGFEALKKQTKKGRLDLEGISICGQSVYLADERVRMVHKIDLEKRTITTLPLKHDSALWWTGSENAGLEGVSVACVDQKPSDLWVAKEREQRFLARFDPIDFKLTAIYDWQQPDLLQKITEDIADLAFADKQLFALERNRRVISRFEQEKLLPVYDYSAHESGLYLSDEPYGQAEALTFKDRRLYIGWDQNDHRLSPKSEVALGAKGVRGVIMVFDLSQ